MTGIPSFLYSRIRAISLNTTNLKKYTHKGSLIHTQYKSLKKLFEKKKT